MASAVQSLEGRYGFKRRLMRLTFIACVITTFAMLLVSPAVPITAGGDATASAATLDISDSSSPLVVQVTDDSTLSEVLDLAASRGWEASYSAQVPEIISISSFSDSGTAADELAGIAGVVSVSSERSARISYVPNDPMASGQWALDTINAYEAWDIGQGTHDIVVAVLDTGIDWNHPDLAANMWTNGDGYHGYNFIDENWFPMDNNVNGYDNDGNWVPNTYTYHGTHVAGIVGAVLNNAAGIAGIAQVQLMAVKVMNESGEGTDLDVAQGIRWAAANGADIITMSLGVEGVTTTLQTAVAYAQSLGVVMVAAAGNSATSTLSYPAAFGPVIAVGAVDSSFDRASFSNYGTGLDIMAPGVQIDSCMGGGSYQELSGTSAAAPHVAGVAAVMLSINPALTPVEIGAAINNTAIDISRTGFDTWTGWGIVDAFRAVESVAAPTVTVTDFPEFVEPNGTYSVTWLVSGGDPGTIQSTYISWGESPTSLTQSTQSRTGTTWASFTESGLPSLPGNGTIYVKAFAQVDGVLYESAAIEIPVHAAAPNGFFMEFFKEVEKFIFEDLGFLNFLIILGLLILIPIIVVAARPKRKKAVIMSSYQRPATAYQTRSSLQQYQSVAAAAHTAPPPPPPPPRFETYIDLVGREVIPQVVRVYEGTKVVWINRAWTPPPGVAIKSGRLDSMGEHPDGLFQSGMLIAPGDYWSCMFHRSGVYDYYFTGIWKQGKIVVEPYRVGS